MNRTFLGTLTLYILALVSSTVVSSEAAAASRTVLFVLTSSPGKTVQVKP